MGGGKVDVNTTITGATKCKITYDSKGLVTGGANLAASDIPSLDAGKITSGTLPDARIASATTWNNKSNKVYRHFITFVYSYRLESGIAYDRLYFTLYSTKSTAHTYEELANMISSSGFPCWHHNTEFSTTRFGFLTSLTPDGGTPTKYQAKYIAPTSFNTVEAFWLSRLSTINDIVAEI